MKFIRSLVVILLVFCVYIEPIAEATTVAIMPVPSIQFFDTNGVVLSGGQVYTYLSGTTTPAPSYTDYTGTVANTNPITLTSAGRAPSGIWLPTGVSYRIVVKDASGNVISTTDGITNASLSCAANGYACLDSNGYIQQSNLNYIYPGVTGGTNRTVQNRLTDVLSVKDLGAKGDGSTDDTTAIANGVAACNGGTWASCSLYFPAGTYRTAKITGIRAIGFHMYGAGVGTTVLKSVATDHLIEITGNSNISSVEIDHMSLDGNSGTSNIGIYMHDNGSGSVAATYLHDLRILGVGGQAIYMQKEFSSNLTNILGSSANNNVFEIDGGPGDVLTNVYAQNVGSGYSGFRIYNSLTMVSCNGVNVAPNANWGLFGGDTSKGDRFTSYPVMNIVGGNVEAFSQVGMRFRAGGTANIIGTTFDADQTGTNVVTAILFETPYSAQATGMASGLRFLISGGNTWTNGTPIHTVGSVNSVPPMLFNGVGTSIGDVFYCEDCSATKALPETGTGQMPSFGGGTELANQLQVTGTLMANGPFTLWDLSNGNAWELFPDSGATNEFRLHVVGGADEFVLTSAGNLTLPNGGLTTQTTVNAVGGFKFNGAAGYTGTKTMGSCTVTIQGGIITNVTGC
jgi:hypothetical protein